MLKYLWDPANAITSFGVLCSSIALCFALAGQLELAVATALWAVLADHLDGVVAGRTPDRDVDIAKMGKSLDGFADLIYGAILPAVILVQLNAVSTLSYFVAAGLLLAGTIRLSYFANFGKSDDGRFFGVPLSYDIPLMAALLLPQPLVRPEVFLTVVNMSFAVLAIAHVAPFRVHAPDRVMYTIITLFCIGSSFFLIKRGMFHYT